MKVSISRFYGDQKRDLQWRAKFSDQIYFPTYISKTIFYTVLAYPDITWSSFGYRSSNTKLKIQSGSKFLHVTVHPVQGTMIDRDDDRERSLKIEAPISKWIIVCVYFSSISFLRDLDW